MESEGEYTGSVKAKHRNLESARIVQVATSFVCKVRKKLLNENNADELAATRKRKQEHGQRSVDSLGRPEFVRRVHDTMEGNPGKSMLDILPNIFQCLKE
ncbi:hypothetical protein ACTXT7_005329 [Hymenolepis weldensis]